MVNRTHQGFLCQLGSLCSSHGHEGVGALAHPRAPAHTAHLLLQHAIKIFPSFHTESITGD